MSDIIIIITTLIVRPPLSLSLQIQHSSPPSSPLSSPSWPSVWQGFGRKAKLLLPYVWPKGTPALQVLVLLCVGLLATERLVNVLVPVYSKNIGKHLKTEKLLKNQILIFLTSLN